MCLNYGKRFAGICLALLLALLFPVQLFSQSPKVQVLEQLTNYQIQLNLVNKQILDYSKQIVNLNRQIAQLQIDLQTSQDNDQKIIDDIKKQLADSKILLEQSQKDLLIQQELYKTLSMGLEKLKTSSQVSRIIKNAAIGIVIAESVYIIIDKIILPTVNK